ncbi:hypothetical protein D4764_19G0000730 [Takifugu flavidus]|uniref:Uncharacterized protein n=1 Tax=Takifugu flavidus TaxID=433684 RepID=A0A5C6NMW9_9TELE|nr:hypothetical protein D4764_19G0000730 [Takifugu flavidus]
MAADRNAPLDDLGQQRKPPGERGKAHEPQAVCSATATATHKPSGPNLSKVDGFSTSVDSCTVTPPSPQERRGEERRGEERRGEERRGEERRGEERRPFPSGVTEACQVIMFLDPGSLGL